MSQEGTVAGRHFEDFVVGQVFGSGSLVVDTGQIQRFAAEFDPQPFHLDEEAAKDSLFGELVASGWHTVALTMRLLVEGDLKPAGGIIGVSFDHLRWSRPVRPGDELRAETEVVELRPSESRPDRGWLKLRTVTRNQADEPVLVLVGTLVVPRRGSG